MRMHQFTIAPIEFTRGTTRDNTYIFSEQGKALSVVIVRDRYFYADTIDTCCTREIIRDTLQREMMTDIENDIRNRDKWHAAVAGLPGYMNDVREQLETALSQHAEGALK